MKTTRLHSFLCITLFVLLITSSAWSANIRTQTQPLERNGISLFLQRMTSDAGTSPKRQILLVHGLTFSSHEFDLDYKDYSFARWLAGQGCDVWLLDIAGYGKSGQVQDGFQPDSDYAAEDINAAVDAIRKASGQDTVDVLGWSWGTVTSGRFAARYPEKVRSLVLYAPIVAGLGQSEVSEAFKTEAWKGASDDFQLGKDGKIDPEITEPGIVELFDVNTRQFDSRPVPNGGRRDLLVSGKERLIPSASLKMPVFLILGDKDDYVSVKLAKEAADSIPGSEMQVFQGGGHALFMEKPHYRKFREAVLAFLQKH